MAVIKKVKIGDTNYHVSSIFIGTCDTAAATAEKAVVTTDTSFVPFAGAMIAVKFTNTSTASNVKLNVNGTGAKNIWVGNAVYASTGSQYNGYANRYIFYIYDGTNWVWVHPGYNLDNNTQTGYCTTAATSVTKVVNYTDYALRKGNLFIVSFKNAGGAVNNMGMNVNSTGAKPLFVNGSRGHSNNTFEAGTYACYYDGTNYYIRTDGGIPHGNDGSDMVQETAESHNAYYVEKDIKPYFNDGTIWDRIAGTNGFKPCEGIYPGCYFNMSRAVTAPGATESGGQKVIVAGINTFKNERDMNYNHLVIISSGHFGNGVMNSTATSTGAYKNSYMNKSLIGSVVSAGSTATGATINQQLYAEFGTHLKSYDVHLSSSINASGYGRQGTAGGCSNNWEVTTVQARLMGEIEAYGSIAWSSSAFDCGGSMTQLPLFRLSHNMLQRGMYSYWLKDVTTNAAFAECHATNVGVPAHQAANSRLYVRPMFIIA